MKSESLILGRDLNRIVSQLEIWGTKSREDLLAQLFLEHFERQGWVDVEPVKLKPTWRNNHIGEDSISKWLERYLINRHISDTMGLFKPWVGQT